MARRKTQFIFYALIITFIIIAATGCSQLPPTPDNYTIDQDSVASITNVVGNRRLAETTSDVAEARGMKTLVFRYVEVNDPQSDLIKYVDYLRKNGYVSLAEADLAFTPGTLQLGVPSTESGKSFIITIAYYENSYDVQVDKANGDIKTPTAS